MAWLDVNPPVRDQWYEKRNRPLTGCTVLHTSESVMDTLGPDTGAEAVADFIRRRTTPGSYHDLCDSDSAIYLVDYSHGAYHDGTGSNNWALSISWACRTTDWGKMSPEKRRAFLRQGAIAFKRQQDYRRSVGAPLTELRLITKAQSDAGMSGFIYHGLRDPGRRTDPGTTAAAPFPITEFINECRAVLAGQEDDMPLNQDDLNKVSVIARDQARAALEHPVIDWGGGHEVSVAQQTADNAKAIGAVSSQVSGLVAMVQTIAASIDGVDAEELKSHISAEVDRAMEEFRERVAEGYEVRLEPKNEVPST